MEILFRGKRCDTNKNELVFGYFEADGLEQDGRNCPFGWIRNVDLSSDKAKVNSFMVDRDTVGQFTGMYDKNGSKIFVGDIVRFNCQLFEVVMECGAFGLGCKDAIDYDKLEESVHKETTNWYCGCCNDNFISLYEIYSNFNCEENIIQPVDVVGNKFDGFKYEMMPKEFVVGEDGEKK